MSRAAHGVRRGEAGVTLVELLVVIAILGVVGAIVTGGVVNGMRAADYGQRRISALAEAQKGLERMSREMRAADPLRVAEPRVAAADVRRGGNLEHYRYSLVADPARPGRYHLVEQRRIFTDPAVFDAPGFDPTTATPDQQSEQVLVADLVDRPVFAYLDRSGEPFDHAATPAPRPDRARRVIVTVERLFDADRGPITVETTVQIRNA